MKENTLRVLLIEDDEDDYILTSELLREVTETKYEIVWVSKYSDGMVAILNGDYDVCLIDYRLGEGTGIELLREATGAGCYTPMILLTGQGGKEIDIKATEAGAADYIVKGQIEAPLLERSIRYAIANSKMLNNLRESENRFRSIVESASDAIILTDNEGIIISWNNSARRIFGYTYEEAVGQPISLLFPENYCQEKSGIVPLVTLGLSQLENRAVELFGVRKGGKEFPLEISLSSWSTPEDTFYSSIIRDITKRRSLEDQLQQAQKLESIGQLAAGIAHEINTPAQYVGDNICFLKDSFRDFITVLIKNEQLLNACQFNPEAAELVGEMKEAIEQADLEYLMEEVPNAVQQALDGVSRITKIVQSMKEFAHPGSTDKTAADLNKAIESTITVAGNEWKYVAELKTDYDKNLPAVSCLLGELNQVILNMIINAAHAIADVVGDGSRGKGTISISTRHNADWAEIRISDSGAGIPEEIRQKIFDPFFTTKEVGKGSGQGLAISHSVIVEKHKGFINVESEVGKGTTFIISLPINEEAFEPPGTPALLLT